MGIFLASISSAEEVMFHLHPCLSVGLSAGLHENYRTDFHKTWMEDGSLFFVLTCFNVAGEGERGELDTGLLTVMRLERIKGDCSCWSLRWCLTQNSCLKEFMTNTLFYSFHLLNYRLLIHIDKLNLYIQPIRRNEKPLQQLQTYSCLSQCLAPGQRYWCSI